MKIEISASLYINFSNLNESSSDDDLLVYLVSLTKVNYYFFQGEVAYIRVKEDTGESSDRGRGGGSFGGGGGGGGGGGYDRGYERDRSRSRSFSPRPRRRGTPTYSPVRRASFSRSRSDSRSNY